MPKDEVGICEMIDLFHPGLPALLYPHRGIP